MSVKYKLIRKNNLSKRRAHNGQGCNRQTIRPQLRKNEKKELMTTDKFSLTELQSKTIDFLRFPLALMVVFIHNPLLEGINMQSINYSSFTGFDFYTIVGTFLSLTLTHIAVPCFFMFSGFLFFCKITDFTPSLYTNKLKKRALTLLIPYILWCLVPIGMSFAKAVLHDNLIGFWTKLTDKGFLSIFWNYTSWHSAVNNFTNYGPALLPLWFLRDLIISVILSPLVYYLVKHTKVWGIVALGLLYYFKVPSDFISYNINQLITALFFFSIGSYFSIHGQNLVLSFRKRQTILYIIAGVSLVLTVFCYNTTAIKFLYPIQCRLVKKSSKIAEKKAVECLPI
jgi:surface polysaccharide O-acyltransferase-like enzyme